MIKKGIYIVSETACLKPGSGAFQHIHHGFTNLEKKFGMELVAFCSPYTNQEGVALGSDSSVRRKINGFKRNRAFKLLWESFRWLYTFLNNHLKVIRYYSLVKRISPDFIYERAGFLNFNGIIIAKLLRIPHAYEVNGILSEDNAKYFPHPFTRLGFYLEKTVYRKSDFGFYVGGINENYNIPEGKFRIVQNGIDKEFVERFKEHRNARYDKINVTFIGHAMDHHRLDVLVNAISLLENPNQFRFHFIGSNLDSLRDLIPRGVDAVFYGSLSQEEISRIISTFNVGVVTFALSFYSHVKVFMYGAAKLVIMLPDSRNFKNVFKDDEVLFFKNGDSSDLAEKLNLVERNFSAIETMSEKGYKKIAGEYTWEKIYDSVCDDIQHLIVRR